MLSLIECLDELIEFLETIPQEEYQMLTLEQQFEIHSLRVVLDV